MGWRLKINFSDGSDELVDELFESEEDALAEYNICLESWNEGREVLQLAGEEYCDEDIEDCDIWEE